MVRDGGDVGNGQLLDARTKKIEKGRFYRNGMIEKKIADKIRQIRKNRGLTLADLSRAIGLSKGLLSRIENNQVSPPIATLSKIAQGLDVHIGIFFEEQRSGSLITP
jgi:DNA-binding XRE family transcriptional regulator